MSMSHFLFLLGFPDGSQTLDRSLEEEDYFSNETILLFTLLVFFFRCHL
jgi:hypothetical protein